jgi:hypothetical protein
VNDRRAGETERHLANEFGVDRKRKVGLVASVWLSS